MTKRTFFLALFVCLLATSLSSQINLTVERISDTEVIITGTGQTDAPAPPQRAARFALLDAVNGTPTSVTLSDNTLEIGGQALTGHNFFASGNPNPTFVLLFAANLPAGEEISGSVTITIEGATWKDLGTTNDFWWGYNNSLVWTRNLGDYTIVAPVAPVPTMGEWALIIFGLIILSFGAVYVMRWQSINSKSIATA